MAKLHSPASSFEFTANLILIVVLISGGTEGLGRRANPKHFTVSRWFLDNPALSTTPYSECKSEVVGKVTRVEVVGCDGDKCTLQGGTNATFNLNFVINVNTNTLKAEVHGIVGSIPIPFHIPHWDACKDSGLACPLVAGKEYQYTTTIPVLKSYPKMNVKVKWELVTDKGQDVICIIIPAQIS